MPFSIGIENSKFPQNIGTLFRSADVFGADSVFTIGHRYSTQRTETQAKSREAELFDFDSVSELRRRMRRYALVGAELHADAQPLDTFEHPEWACYLLGSEDRGLSADAIDACDMLIQIPYGRYSLNVATAGGIVIWDRIAKRAGVA